MSKKVKIFRAVAMMEGVSYLLLLFMAMPLKYMAGMPIFVKIVGMAHGVLFLWFLFAQLQAHLDQKWRLSFNIYALLASLIPFGTFVLEKKLKDTEFMKSYIKN